MTDFPEFCRQSRLESVATYMTTASPPLTVDEVVMMSKRQFIDIFGTVKGAIFYNRFHNALREERAKHDSIQALTNNVFDVISTVSIAKEVIQPTVSAKGSPAKVAGAQVVTNRDLAEDLDTNYLLSSASNKIAENKEMKESSSKQAASDITDSKIGQLTDREPTTPMKDDRRSITKTSMHPSMSHLLRASCNLMSASYYQHFLQIFSLSGARRMNIAKDKVRN